MPKTAGRLRSGPQFAHTSAHYVQVNAMFGSWVFGCLPWVCLNVQCQTLLEGSAVALCLHTLLHTKCQKLCFFGTCRGCVQKAHCQKLLEGSGVALRFRIPLDTTCQPDHPPCKLWLKGDGMPLQALPKPRYKARHRT